MSRSQTDDVESTLQEPEVHASWEEIYRTPENEAFYEMAFDEIARTLNAPANSVILDVGCGSCAHSMRLAQRGFEVVAVDFSEPVLKAAEPNLVERGMTGRVRLERQNVLSLTYPSGSFEYILCWGVLMHIPEIEQAISELERVLMPGGWFVLAENNMHSVQALLRRAFHYLRSRGSTQMVRTEAGLEWWTSTTSGRLLTRNADTGWLIQEFTRRGYSIVKVMPGQFSEFYVKIPGKVLKKLVHIFNSIWFKYIKRPGLAFGNILIVRKGRV